MAAARSDSEAGHLTVPGGVPGEVPVLDQVPGDIVVLDCRRADPCPSVAERPCQGVHSYPPDRDPDSSLVQRWCWRPDDPGAGCAIDVEDVQVEIPAELLAAHHGPVEQFWQHWTSLEVLAKLTDTPVLLLVRQGALGRPVPVGQGPAAIVMEHFRVGTHLCCRGRFEPKERA